MLDWDILFLNLLEFKKLCGFHNLILSKDELKIILYTNGTSNKYKIFYSDDKLEIKKIQGYQNDTRGS
jgi:hypothetical protein